mgnify:CR=1 FL=1
MSKPIGKEVEGKYQLRAYNFCPKTNTPIPSPYSFHINLLRQPNTSESYFCGVLKEDIVWMLIDQYEAYQKSNYPHPNNELILTKLRSVLDLMKNRYED